MRIRAFSYFIEPYCDPYTLNNTDLVIDGQNFMYDVYEQSNLQYVFGCESDKFAENLRSTLGKFQKANVKCYFVFKGGHNSVDKIRTDKVVNGSSFNINEPSFVMPVLTKCIYKDVLQEMGINQVICELESKQECIALAQKLKCPVLSFDIEYVFSGVPYISHKSLDVSRPNTGSISCQIFRLERFLEKLNLSVDKLSVFIALCNNPTDDIDFQNFFKSINAGHFKTKYAKLFQWLSRTSRDMALKCTCQYLLTHEERKMFLEKELVAKTLVQRQETMGLPANYLMTGKIQIFENDPLWFEKGIILRHIPVPYINLRNYSVYFGSWTIEDQNQEDSVLLSLDIIEYAHGLLTNFNKELEFKTFRTLNTPRVAFEELQRSKPNHQAELSVFENGWDNIRSLGLFENFLKVFLRGFDYNALERIPASAQLLLIALVYFRHKKGECLLNLEYSIILSYVALELVRTRRVERDIKSKKELLDALDTANITENEKKEAAEALKEYFSCSRGDARLIFNAKRLHPLVEFQHCLQQLNHLNALCGEPYQRTDYTRTFNGTFVYKLLCYFEDEGRSNSLESVRQKLTRAPTVYGYFEAIVGAFEEFHIIHP